MTRSYNNSYTKITIAIVVQQITLQQRLGGQVSANKNVSTFIQPSMPKNARIQALSTIIPLVMLCWDLDASINAMLVSIYKSLWLGYLKSFGGVI
ncbi:hypothetical protein CR513_11774, partial [Mucuna pruriens]